MKKIKRVQAFVMALVMLVSTVVFAGADIQRVSAAATFTVNIHYHREDGNYTDWNVWAWTDDGAVGGAHTFDTTDENGDPVATIQVPVGSPRLGFIIRRGEWEEKDLESDQFIPTGDYVGGTLEYYVNSGKPGTPDETNITKGCVIAKSALDETDYQKINVKFNIDPATADEPIDVTKAVSMVDSDGKTVEIAEITSDGADAVITLKEAIDIEDACMSSRSYKIIFNEIEYYVTLPDYFSSETFEDKYTYKGNDLGAVYTQAATTFKLWAPSAASIKVKLFSEGLPLEDKSVDGKVIKVFNEEDYAKAFIKEAEMTMGENGVWTAVVNEDLKNKYYTYEVTFKDGTVNEACDPYAKAVGVNGDMAMVVDLDSTDPEGWENDTNPQSGIASYADCSIWEVQVRDFSYDTESGVKEENRGKYLAFTEEGTKNTAGQSTCLDYIKQLGVTHVQINPAYDYATVDETKLDRDQYNWGYDPKNYNAPEGSFSTDPYHGEVRVNEFKQMVQSLHKAGIGVVMDVVYNHTYNTDYCFNKIVPNYFYRGTNGSGCGNDVASERAMVSKFIVDSVLYWHDEYHIDGFRFDLVGLIDVDTINKITEELHKIDPSIILYGEGWTIDTGVTKEGVALANQGNWKLTPGFAYFNDSIRDNLKGHVFTATDKGYINGASGKAGDIYDCARGAANWTWLLSDPLQMINYSSCHDNYTLWDKIATSNPEDSFDLRVKQNNLAAAITFTSQGIPFILAGEEILRTKVKEDGTFDENSYASPSAENSIKWGTLSIEKYQNVLEYYKGIIAFRNAHPALRMSDGSDVDKYLEPINMTNGDKNSPKFKDGIVQYMISGYDKDEDIIVIYNPNNKDYSIKLPDGAWNVCVQGDKAGTKALSTVAGSVKVNAVSATVLVRGTQENIASKAKVSGISNKTYTGKSITMSGLKVKYGTKTLKEGTDYTVKYSNNKNAGKASIKITFKGLYKGSVTKNFTIKKASQSISVKTSISKKAKSKPFSLGAKLKKGNGKLSYKSSSTKIAKVNKSGKVTLTGKKGTVKITVTASSTSNYNKATKKVTIKVK
ncbi:MAG: type I pullulanase [Lachnospiraceae bacterium]|nr:type I pullulanase [Lachnospiraceae bacterium]